MILKIKYNSNHPFEVEVQPTWNVQTLKKEISKKYKIPLKEIKIIFQGRDLGDTVNLKDCDFGKETVIHAVQGINLVGQNVPVPTLRKDEAAGNETLLVSLIPTQEKIKNQYYVYCKTCKGIQPGRIRVRCSQCKEGAFTVNTDPTDWEDVLVKGKIKGACHPEGNSDSTAEFYFKCSGVDHPSQDQGNAIPLQHVRPNGRNVPCVVCANVSNPILVFPCDGQHVICMDCFENYCCTRLNDRDFSYSEEHGYTVSCAGCNTGLIQEPHHFRLLGNEQYERFQKFGAEEYLLKVGGVLCPFPNCGVGLLPSSSDRKVVCQIPGDSGGCGHVFCRICKETYHGGDCKEQTPPAPPVREFTDPEKLEKARWNNEVHRQVTDRASKPCPKCHQRNEKRGESMQVKCKRCSYRFCWLCAVEWSNNCQSQHWFG